MSLESKYWSYVRCMKFILSMTGLWPVITERRPSVIQHIIANFFLICDVAMIFSISYFCWSAQNHLEALLKSMGSLCSTILVLVKRVALIRNREIMSELVNTLGVLSKSQFTDTKLQPLRLGLLPKLSRYSYIQSVSVGYTVISYSLAPIVIILHQKLSGITPITYVYPFPSKFPWDKEGEGGILYGIHYLYNFMIGWTCFSSVVGLDSLFCLFIIQLCGHLRILAFNFRNLNPDINYNENFRECVKRHCLLMRCRDNLQTAYGAAILTHFISNSLVMCALIFQISQTKIISMGKALTFAFFFASKFVQAFMYSWCGTLLTTESEAVSYAVFQSDWTSFLDKKKMRNIRMVLCQRPLILTACHITVVSLPMFTTILNTAVSYFCLLKSVEEEEE